MWLKKFSNVANFFFREISYTFDFAANARIQRMRTVNARSVEVWKTSGSCCAHKTNTNGGHYTLRMKAWELECFCFLAFPKKKLCQVNYESPLQPLHAYSQQIFSVFWCFAFFFCDTYRRPYWGAWRKHLGVGRWIPPSSGNIPASHPDCSAPQSNCKYILSAAS